MVYSAGGNELLDPQKIFERLGIKQGDRVADLGCGGAGHFILPAAKIVGPDSTAYAVDILKTVLQNVMTKARPAGIKNLKSVWSNLEKPGATAIPEESLDAAFLINILFQSKKHQEIITEAKRLLKSGGKLLVIDWTTENISFGPDHKMRISPNRVKEIASSLHFTLVEEFQAGVFHFGLIFQK